MRNPERIDEFCLELARIRKTQVPDWRFGQLVSNVSGQMESEGKDIFFPEDEEMLLYLKKYFHIEE